MLNNHFSMQRGRRGRRGRWNGGDEGDGGDGGDEGDGGDGGDGAAPSSLGCTGRSSFLLFVRKQQWGRGQKV